MFAALVLQGCAGSDTLPKPLHLGGWVGDGDQTDAGDEKRALSVLQHVPSNKVLGAMAFQKVTGKQIDPVRLKATPEP